jgi:hypothetical protein
MSLTETLLNQTPILAGLGLTAGLMLLAILFAFVSYLRQLGIGRRRRTEQTIYDEVVAAAVEEDVPAEAAVIRATRASLPASPAVEAAPAEQPEEQPAAPEPEVSSELQDIIASVFMDDDRFARYEMLRRDVPAVDIHELAALCQSIAGQLREPQPQIRLVKNGAAHS